MDSVVLKMRMFTNFKKTMLLQEEVGTCEDGSEETVSLLQPDSSFGEISILCNIPQPYTVRVCELCRLLRLDKQSFTNVLDIYFYDGRKILNNLLEVIISVTVCAFTLVPEILSVAVEFRIEYNIEILLKTFFKILEQLTLIFYYVPIRWLKLYIKKCTGKRVQSSQAIGVRYHISYWKTRS